MRRVIDVGALDAALVRSGHRNGDRGPKSVTCRIGVGTETPSPRRRESLEPLEETIHDPGEAADR